MSTARDICTKSLKLSGAVAGIQVPTADEIELALYELNALVAGWAIESWWCPSQIQRTFTPSAISDSITIGNGLITPDITDVPPFRIDCIYLQESSTYYKLNEKPRVNIAPTTSTGLPSSYSYQRQTPTEGVITFDVMPDKLYGYKLIYDSSIPSYLLDDEVMLPPAHVSAIEWNLAVVMGIHFGKVDSSVANIAEARFNRIKMNQVKVPNCIYDYVGYANDSQSQSYNIYTDR